MPFIDCHPIARCASVTSSVLITIVIGIGLAYLYCRKPSSSSSSSSSFTSRLSSSYPTSRLSSRFGTSRGNSSASGAIDADLQRAIAEIERQERDTIRQEQDAAYQQSLQADREKKLKKEEELRDREAREQAERQRQRQLDELHQSLASLKCNIASKLPGEPSQVDRGAVRLVFKLPDGTRIKRNFFRHDKIKYLYWFVFSLSNAPLQFKMTTNFPKRDLPGRPPRPEDFVAKGDGLEEVACQDSDSEQTLEQMSLTETQIIFVYDLEA